MDKEIILTINVGGAIYNVAKSTLQQFPDSFLCRMFSSDLGMASGLKDRNGNPFIDRNATFFEKILDIYRNGKIPVNVKGQLRKEIKFFFPGYLGIE